MLTVMGVPMFSLDEVPQMFGLVCGAVQTQPGGTLSATETIL